MNLNKSISILVFTLLIESTAYGQILQEGFHIPSAFPTSAAFGDLDGDGDVDFIQALNQFTGSDPINANKIWLNNGDNTFALHNTLGTSQTEDIELTDIDNDGDLDIIAGNTEVSSISKVWINDGFANFTSGQSLGGQETWVVVVADFNEDGYPDTFLGTYDLGAEDVLYMSQGNGQLSLTSIPWTTGTRTTDAEAKDINGDGHMDIIICKGNAPLNSRRENEVWFGNGDGTFFKSPQIFPLVASFNMAIGDYDNNGFIDVIFEEDNAVIGYLNDGSTLFNNSEVLSNAYSVTDIDLIDIDVDGDLDLVIGRFAGFDGFESEVLFNDGAGSFTDGSEQFSVADTFGIEYYDIDQDDDIDLLTINKNNQDNVFWINQTDPILSVLENKMFDLFLYPNPTRDFLKIGDTNGQTVADCEVFDSRGNLILSAENKNTETMLDVSSLSSGVYFCKITMGTDISRTLKFVKY
jgi:hypothetical protein